jgi:hypothetical protein
MEVTYRIRDSIRERSARWKMKMRRTVRLYVDHGGAYDSLNNEAMLTKALRQRPSIESFAQQAVGAV